MYTLHPTLAADSILLGQLTLCDVLLINNSSYMWLALVPRLAAVREIYELSEADQWQLNKESCWVSKQIAGFTQADKMNVAAFGNQVPQLHLHIIARHSTDPAWPQPAWLRLDPKPYTPEDAAARKSELRQLLNLT